MANILNKFAVLAVIDISEGRNQIIEISDCFLSDDSLFYGGVVFLVKYFNTCNISHENIPIERFEDWLLNRDRENLLFLSDSLVVSLTTSQVTFP